MRDSAGIQIVENERPQQDSSSFWLLSDEPDLLIGSPGGEGPQSLYRVLDAIQFADGDIAVVDGSSQEIRVFDAAGGHVKTYGGQGGGPGRFQALASVFASGDSLVAFDHRTRSLAVFSLTSDGVRTSSVADPENRGDLSLVGRLPDGTFLTHSGGSPFAAERLEGIIQTPEWISKWDPTSGTVQDVVELPGPEMVAASDGAGPFIMSRPFGRQSYYCLNGGRIVTGYTESYDLHYHDSGGSLIRAARKKGEVEPMTGADIRAYREGPQIHIRGRPVADLLSETDYPPTKPTHGDLICDTQGNVWVKAYAQPGETGPANWSVFNATGYWITDVQTPASFSVMEIGDDYVLGILRDESDVEFVVRYRLLK